MSHPSSSPNFLTQPLFAQQEHMIVYKLVSDFTDMINSYYFVFDQVIFDTSVQPSCLAEDVYSSSDCIANNCICVVAIVHKSC